MHSFDALMDTLRPVAGRCEWDIPPDWGQGRAIYGGLVGAALARCARSVAPEERALRSVLISFVGPTAPGVAQLSARVMRSGKHVTQVEARLEQDGDTRSVALLSYVAARDSVVRVEPEGPLEVPAPEACQEVPYVEGLVPRFLQHFAMRWSLGALPFSKSSTGELGGWCRMREATGTLSCEHVLALVDAWPPTLLTMLDKPAPSSTITWSVDLVAPPSGTADGWCLYHAKTLAAGHGHGHTDARLWAPDGGLLATSRQFVAVFG